MSRSPDERLLDAVPDQLLTGTVLTVNTTACTATVRLPSVDDLPHGPASYTPIALGDGDATVVHHPRRGTRCLVVEDTEDRMWIPIWSLTT